ncbi:MAG: class I SAM-dependent methyltransferase [Bacilli bacterium]
MAQLSELQPIMRDFLQRGLVISPWLAGINENRRFDEKVFFLIDEAAQEFTDAVWTEELQTRVFGELPVLPRVPRTAFYEISASTAAWLAHGELGQAEATESTAERAIAMIHQFCSEYDFATLVQLYGLATQYENHQAVAYYGEMPERIFVLGRWHRPWVDYSLNDELTLGVLAGNYLVNVVDGQRMVTLTAKGMNRFRETEQFLNETGYLAHRVRQLYVSRFNLFPNFGQLAKAILPDWIPQRQEFCVWAGIEPGMTVLELGCGDGLFTFDGGLAERVGPAGRLVATDPARGMLAKAMAKGRERAAHWVEFVQAPAEQLPFPDGAFDAVVGVSFLHLTNLPQALAEMRRVVRPGGIAATFYPLQKSLDAPFFREWFAPLLALAAQDQRERPDDFLVSATEMARAWEQAGFGQMQSHTVTSRSQYWDPELLNQLFHGVGWGQEELARIPWKAREDVLAQVAACGREVCARYPKEERVIDAPMQMLKATTV